jgi:hypothetical protein
MGSPDEQRPGRAAAVPLRYTNRTEPRTQKPLGLGLWLDHEKEDGHECFKEHVKTNCELSKLTI